MQSAQTPAIGIYFDMPDDEYHKIAALSASGIKNLLISPVDFWARSWMNPKNNSGEDDITDTEAKILGRAYDKRITEGKVAFYRKYAPEYEIQQGELKTADDMRTACKKLGLKVEGTKQQLILRLMKSGSQRIYEVSRAEHLAQHEGKEFLPYWAVENIELSAAMIEMNPKIARCFAGGYPQVVVIWEHEGILYKARFDYLKFKAIIDLKTFDNRQMKSFDRAVYGAMAMYKYHIQSTLYLRAIEEAKKFIAQGRIFTRNDLVVSWQNEESMQIASFCDKVAECEEHEFYFVFQQKGIAPFARCYKFPKTSMWSVANVQIDAAVEIFRQNFDRFGTEMWVDDADISTLEDEGFPVWATSDL